jgi:3-oxoadipate enol-lactonase
MRPASPPAVHWRTSGRGPALVLLNGWSASGLAWPRSWIRRLGASFRVIRVDNRGSGWSRHAPTPFTMADLADDVADVLDAEGVERATVLGLSMGGMIAQELALRAPDRGR